MQEWEKKKAVWIMIYEAEQVSKMFSGLRMKTREEHATGI